MLKVEQLKNIKVLSGLPDVALSKILPYCILRNYDKGEVIFEYNKKINSLYMILSGEVDFCLPLKNRQNITIHRAKRGETFGVSSILPEDCTTIFSAIGFEKGELIEIKASNLISIFREDKKMEFIFLSSALKIYNQKKLRQNMLLVKSILSHNEIKKIIS